MLLNQTLRQLLLEPIPQKLRRLLAKRRETRQRAVVLHQLHDCNDPVAVFARCFEAFAEQATEFGERCTTEATKDVDVFKR